MKLLHCCLYTVHILTRNKLLLIVSFILPLLIILISGDAISKIEENVVPISVVDRDLSEESYSLIQSFTQNKTYKILHVDGETAESLLDQNRIEALIIINEGFSDRLKSSDLINLITFKQSSTSISAGLIKESISYYILRIHSAFYVAKKISNNLEPNNIEKSGMYKTVLDYINTINNSKTFVEPKIITQNSGITQNKVFSPYSTHIGIVLMTLMFYLMISGSFLIDQNKSGIITRLKSFSDSFHSFYLGSILGFNILGIFYIFISSLFIYLLFDVTLFKTPFMFFTYIIYINAIISISYFLSSFFKSSKGYQSFAPIYVFLTSVVGGCLWNFSTLSKKIHFITLLTPQGLAIEGLKNIQLTSISFQSYLPQIILSFSFIILYSLSFNSYGKKI